MLLESLPTLPVLASLLAHILTFFFPTLLLTELLALLLAHPPDAARTTAEFLKSHHGVRQALHMAADELQTITHDRWDEEIWGAADPSPVEAPRPKLFFLFGKDDHWVADETRDELMAARGRARGERRDGERWKPVMEVDESGIPHGFCIGEFFLSLSLEGWWKLEGYCPHERAFLKIAPWTQMLFVSCGFCGSC